MYLSTVDWCENNYAISEYIAEFWNTITFFPILISAIYWRKQYPKIFILHLSFHNIFLYLVLVSIGTALFHGTLLYPFQLLDELPMVLLSAYYIDFLLSLENITRSNSFLITVISKLFVKIRYILITIIVFSYFYSPFLQITLFHSFLKIFELIIIVLIYNTSTQLKTIVSENNIEFQNLHKKINYHIFNGLLCYLVAGILWISEHLFCHYIEFMQFHAFWHIFSSIGIYHLNCIISNHYLINKLIHYNV